VIQPLRTYHRWTFLILAIAIPVVFVAGLTARRTTPQPKREAMLLASPSGSGKRFNYPILVWSNFPKARLVAIKPIALPDALVYWSNQAPGQNDLPPDSIFLGRLDPAITYQIPNPSPGFFVIYSPAQKAILDYAAFGGRP